MEALNMNPTNTHKFSLLDPDLPLLAIDAAYEIDELIDNLTSKDTQQFSNESLRLSNDLLDRLKEISSAKKTITVDQELLSHSLLSLYGNENIQMRMKPISLAEHLRKTLISYESKNSKKDLPSIRDFFIMISDFCADTQRWARGNSYV